MAGGVKEWFVDGEAVDEATLAEAGGRRMQHQLRRTRWCNKAYTVQEACK